MSTGTIKFKWNKQTQYYNNDSYYTHSLSTVRF